MRGGTTTRSSCATTACYYETADDEASQAALAADPRTVAWEADMARFFATLDGRPDQSSLRLPEIFNLEHQLAKDNA